VRTPTIDDFLQPYRHYPAVVQQAIFRVETHPTFSILTRSMKAVLKAMLTRSSKIDGTAPIKARVDRLATEAAVSTKTVQRTLAVLRKIGWIVHMCDGRSEYGVFTFRLYQFSVALCALVTLPVKGKISPQETIMSDGAIYADLSFKKDQREISIEKRQQDPVAHPISLPAELRQIVALGVKDTGVCKLRGLAHAKGYNLADIFTVAKKRLTELNASGGRVYRYLAAMIDNPKPCDYAGRAGQLVRSGAADKATQKMKSRRQKYAHKRYTAGPGIIVKIFDGVAEVVRNGVWYANIVGSDMNRVYDDIERGKLREIAC